MIGGGPGAFIGDVHRKSARMDGGIELVAGAFDINPRKSKQMGKELCLDAKRTYRTYAEMIEKELEGAKYDLSSAKESLHDKDIKWASVQAYYSIFHAAKSLVLKKGFREKSHYCL